MRTPTLPMRSQPDVVRSSEQFATLYQALASDVKLCERWRAQQRHVVLDAHFDDGARFLATWRLWLDDPGRPQSLHYLAIENQPYDETALAALHAQWPQVAAQSQQLRTDWPLPLSGFHRFWFADGAICLTLIFGELAGCITQIDAQVDTFLFDALAQSSARLLINCGRIAAKDACIYSELSLPEDQALWRSSGFQFDPAASKHCARFAPRWQIPAQAGVDAKQRHAIVIGAGLAGSAIAQRLCARDWRVTLIERHAQPAQEASGNHAGIFMPMLAKDDNPGVRLTRAAFLYALRLWRSIGGVGEAFAGEMCGVLQLTRDASRAQTAQHIASDQRLPSQFAQWLDMAALASMQDMGQVASAMSPEDSAWFFPQGGWLHPAGVCHTMLAACAEKLNAHYDTEIGRMERVGETWQLFDKSDQAIASAPTVILANSAAACQFAQAADLPLARIRGQVTHVPAERLPSVPFVLCREGYLTRAHDGVCSVGASYDIGDDDPALRLSSQRENLLQLDQLLFNQSQQLSDLPLSGRVGFRCVSPDRLPLVGALPDPSACASFRGERLRDVPRLPGLFGALAYASRGLIWAPLAAEILAAQICGEPLPIERDLHATLDPARFFLSHHRRKSH
jgi:tRNA 5-methylaminomethyl-2-thiouridine biosynthesis bifunctional protein